MDYLFLSIIAIISVFVIRKIISNTRQLKRQLYTSSNWRDATEKREHWEKMNPFCGESDPVLQRLLRIEMGAFMLWLDAHPECLKDWRFRTTHQRYLNNLTERVRAY